MAFEVDKIDASVRSGWSVVVTGVARELTDVGVAEAQRLALARWAPRDDHRIVAISTDIVSGQRIMPTTENPSNDHPARSRVHAIR